MNQTTEPEKIALRSPSDAGFAFVMLVSFTSVTIVLHDQCHFLCHKIAINRISFDLIIHLDINIVNG